MNLENTNPNWHKSDFTIAYFSKIIQQLQESETTLIEKIVFRNNYGYIVNTQDILNNQDKLELIAHMIRQLKSIGYVIAKKEADKIYLAASARMKINGEQLYGSTKIINKSEAIHILITPFVDRQYKPALEPQEFIDLLFSV